MTDSAFLILEGLTARFGGVTAVDHLDLTVAAGERIGLIGPNGAGKSTALGLIAGQIRPYAGRLLLEGNDVTGESPQGRARAGIGRTFQDGRPFISLTAAESIEVGHTPRGVRHSRARTVGLLAEVGLQDEADTRCSRLSYVDRKRLEVARALSIEPRILLLDEPFSGLTAGEARGILATLDRVAAQRQLGLIIVEHVVHLVLGFCDRVIVMNQGRVIADGTPGEIRGDNAVIEAYLGAPRDVTARNAPRRSATGPAPVADRGELTVSHLAVARQGLPVLHDLSLTVRRGAVQCLLGPNGAGKTTLLETLAGILPASAGDIRAQPRQLDVALVHQSRGLFPDLTLRDNLLLGCYRSRRREVGAALGRVTDIFPWMASRLTTRAANLSGGEQQMLALGRALLMRPDVLLLDEPSIGVAPVIVAQITEVVEQFASDGGGVLIAEQAIDYVLEIADYGYILDHGSVILEGDREVLSSSDIVRAYFGDLLDTDMTAKAHHELNARPASLSVGRPVVDDTVEVAQVAQGEPATNPNPPATKR